MTASGGLEIAVEDGDAKLAGLVVVRPCGEVDLATAEELASVLRSERCAGAAALIVDLSAVSFMDSSGLEALIRAEREPGRSVAVVSPEGSTVRRLLELTGVTGHMRMAASEEQAVASLGEAPPDDG